jgi:hypothetical protein
MKRRRPRKSVISVSTATWPVKALVLATPISGPTRRYTPASVSRAIVEPTTLMTPSASAPRSLASCSAASVSAVSPDWLTAIDDRAILDDRVAVAELAGILGDRGDLREVLEHVLADHRGVQGGALAHQDDALGHVEFLRVLASRRGRPCPRDVDAAAEAVACSALGCSKISFCMKCSKPPSSICSRSSSSCIDLGRHGTLWIVLVRKPAA